VSKPLTEDQLTAIVDIQLHRLESRLQELLEGKFSEGDSVTVDAKGR
jgi:hypothetical protein